MAFNYSKQKHYLDDTESLFSNKRVKVEHLFEKLLLENTPEHSNKSEFDINPLLNLSNDRKRKRPIGLDSEISEKIFQKFKCRILKGLAMIRYVLPITVLIIHYQMWIKRLFNKFIRKFNRSHPERGRVGFFRSFYKIMAMVENPSIDFTYANLIEIVLKESEIEAYSLALKQSNKLDSKKIDEIKEEETLARECNYKYWDLMAGLSEDIEMEDSL
ncbi:hypothetical protein METBISCDRAFT_17389 [Metschnikowia bicuspidata]|uniref:Uncharacterized protein n=1 Tax=Metschnikowia bicuspidata TaxID=27322 RepID=A0A4P9ZB02_9ASCO|nr:hypothetical protein METBISCDRAFT_17389 [Metschnikowia bicuspidata]